MPTVTIIVEAGAEQVLDFLVKPAFISIDG